MPFTLKLLSSQSRIPPLKIHPHLHSDVTDPTHFLLGSHHETPGMPTHKVLKRRLLGLFGECISSRIEKWVEYSRTSRTPWALQINTTADCTVKENSQSLPMQHYSEAFLQFNTDQAPAMTPKVKLCSPRPHQGQGPQCTRKLCGQIWSLSVFQILPVLKGIQQRGLDKQGECIVSKHIN